MPRRPVVLVHGYSDQGESFDAWKTALLQRGYRATDLSVCSYETLTNEVTINWNAPLVYVSGALQAMAMVEDE